MLTSNTQIYNWFLCTDFVYPKCFSSSLISFVLLQMFWIFYNILSYANMNNVSTSFLISMTLMSFSCLTSLVWPYHLRWLRWWEVTTLTWSHTGEVIQLFSIKHQIACTLIDALCYFEGFLFHYYVLKNFNH